MTAAADDARRRRPVAEEAVRGRREGLREEGRQLLRPPWANVPRQSARKAASDGIRPPRPRR